MGWNLTRRRAGSVRRGAEVSARAPEPVCETLPEGERSAGQCSLEEVRPVEDSLASGRARLKHLSRESRIPARAWSGKSVPGLPTLSAVALRSEEIAARL